MKMLNCSFMKATCALLLIGGVASAQFVDIPFFRAVKTEVMISRPAETKGGDYDDQMQMIRPRIKFTNTDNKQNYERHQASFMIVGESTVDRKVFKVLQRHDFVVTLPARQIVEEQAPDVTTRYDTTDAKFGYKYDGWILVVKDSLGQLALAKSSIPTLEKMPTQLGSLKQDGCYDKQLKPVEEPRLTVR